VLKSILSASVRAIIGCLAATGLVALLLAGLLAAPPHVPPELASVSATAGSVDRTTMPGLDRYPARDGTSLAYRHYPPRGTTAGRIAVLVHGSTGSSATVHALSDALAARGVETFALDIRGHGGSGTRGDIGYVGQLEDDLADMVAVIRKTAPSTPLTLIGHSAGGGFALRVAGSPLQDRFARTVLLAPFLGAFAPTNQPNYGGWAEPDLPRIVALTALRKIGIECCDALPVLAYAVPPNSSQRQTAVYSERLRSNFGVHLDFRTDLAMVRQPLSIFAGVDDELMRSDHYAEAVQGVMPSVTVKLIEGVNHMGIVSDPRAISVIADDVASSGANS
jgi:pimeloyl-ACP methyl ester carboxylesterase